MREASKDSLPCFQASLGSGEVDSVDGDDGIAHVEGRAGIGLVHDDAFGVFIADAHAERAGGQS